MSSILYSKIITKSHKNLLGYTLKNIFEYLFAFLCLVLFAPLMLIIAILIKTTSKGPIIFKQKRSGRKGKIITIYKFRTMYLLSERSKILQAKKNDNRITFIGKIIRGASLDELPQFINVLQGKLSIVGPRPHAIYHDEYYKKLIPNYMIRYSVKPGITGWAQINGLRGRTEKLYKMQSRLEYDLYYLEHKNLSFDLFIILLTPIKGMFHENAY